LQDEEYEEQSQPETQEEELEEPSPKLRRSQRIRNPVKKQEKTEKTRQRRRKRIENDDDQDLTSADRLSLEQEDQQERNDNEEKDDETIEENNLTVIQLLDRRFAKKKGVEYLALWSDKSESWVHEDNLDEEYDELKNSFIQSYKKKKKCK